MFITKHMFFVPDLLGYCLYIRFAPTIGSPESFVVSLRYSRKRWDSFNCFGISGLMLGPWDAKYSDVRAWSSGESGTRELTSKRLTLGIS